MTKPLTQGEKNRRANIRAMKALGAKNAKIRAATKVENFLAHADRNNAAAEAAADRRAQRIADGIAKRDAHNRALAATAAARRSTSNDNDAQPAAIAA